MENLALALGVLLLLGLALWVTVLVRLTGNPVAIASILTVLAMVLIFAGLT